MKLICKPTNNNTKLPVKAQCSFKYTSGDLEERAKCIIDIKKNISNTISNNIKFEDSLFDNDFISGKKTIVGTIYIYTELQ